MISSAEELNPMKMQCFLQKEELPLSQRRTEDDTCSKLTTSDQSCQKAEHELLQRGVPLHPVVFTAALESLPLEAQGEMHRGGGTMHIWLPE